MIEEVLRQKRRLRAELKRRRAAMGLQARAQASARACAALMATPLWDRASTLGVFESMAEEIDTDALIEAAWRTGRRVALPVTPPLGEPLELRWVEPDTPLVRAHYGALEPGASARRAGLDELQLMVVPGLGFDRSGARLGYGGGYYDRTLASGLAAVMLAFGCQEVERIPSEAHDVRMLGIVTEDGWIEPG